MKATPPKVPPPRRLLEPQLNKTAEEAAFRARLARFERDMQLDKEDMSLLQQLNREVAELIMSEPPDSGDLFATRQRCRECIRDPKMEEFLAQIKDLEDDCSLDEQTSARLRSLPRNAIEGILRYDRHWTPETQRQQIQKMVEDVEMVIQARTETQSRMTEHGAGQATNILHAREAKVVFPSKIETRKGPTAKVAEAVQISDSDEGSKGSKAPRSRAKEESPSRNAARKTTTQATVPAKSALMQHVEGIIHAHGHSENFLRETRHYVTRLRLNNMVMYILRMLSSTAAWGVMRTCSGGDPLTIEQEIIQQVQMVNPEAASLGHRLMMQHHWQLAQAGASYWPGVAPGYPYPWGPGWYPHAKPHKSKKKEKKEKKAREKRRTKASKRKSRNSSYTYTDEESSHGCRRKAAMAAMQGAALGRSLESDESMKARFAALIREKEPLPRASRSRERSRSPQTRGPGETESASGAAVETQAELEFKTFLQKLDGGKGALLDYLPKITERYANLRDMANKVQVTNAEAKSGHLGNIDPEFFKECGISRMGHRLLLAKAIVAL